MFSIVLTLVADQESRSRDLTLEMCDPRFLWIPLHSMQMRMPRLMLAQVGEAAPQSAHSVLPATDFLICSRLTCSASLSECRISFLMSVSQARSSLPEQSWKCHCEPQRETR